MKKWARKEKSFFHNDNLLYAIKTVVWLGMKQPSYTNISTIVLIASSCHLTEVKSQWKNAYASVIYWRSTYCAIHKASFIGERGSYILESS